MTPQNGNAAPRGQSWCGAQTQVEQINKEYHGTKPCATDAALQTQFEKLMRDVSYAGLRAGGVAESTRRCLMLRAEVDLALEALGATEGCLNGKLVAL